PMPGTAAFNRSAALLRLSRRSSPFVTHVVLAAPYVIAARRRQMPLSFGCGDRSAMRASRLYSYRIVVTLRPARSRGVIMRRLMMGPDAAPAGGSAQRRHRTRARARSHTV